MTLSETQIDKFCQSPMVSIFPSNRPLDAATPILGTLASAFLAPDFAFCFPSERGLGSEAARKVLAFSDEIQVEEVTICEIGRKNLHSRSYHSGRYSGKQGKGVHAFHQM